MMLPIDVPVMMSTGMPALSRTFITPMCAIPFAPPPLSTTATRFLSTTVLSGQALADTQPIRMAMKISVVLFKLLHFKNG